MRVNTLLCVSLALAAALVQAGCTKKYDRADQAAGAPGSATATGAQAGGQTGPQSGDQAGGQTSPPSRDQAGGQTGPQSGDQAGGRAGSPGAHTAVQPPARSATLPEGTMLAVRTTNALSTKTGTAGQEFTAYLEHALVYEGRDLVAKGAEVDGRIVGASKGGRVKGRANISVRLTRVHLANGEIVDISTSTLAYRARATKGKDAAKIGIGAGIGAGLGAVFGGGAGAAIGAAAGGAGGTGLVLATRGDAAVIPSETVLNFRLAAPATFAE